ncbi:MAG: hypothetical protein RIC15_12155 [Vicingaceae bacterium]
MKFANAPSLLFFIAVFCFSSHRSSAQFSLPFDSTSNLYVLKGQRATEIACKKKVAKIIQVWLAEKQVYPPMVFSTIHRDKRYFVIKGLTEVPSKKGIHPVSFKLEVTLGRKAFGYRFDNFYFEDIKLSLEDWVQKYEASGNERNAANIKLVSGEIESYVFLTLELLTNKINDQ